MNVYNLPENLKVYELELSNKTVYWITSSEKDGIMRSQSQFIKLKSGEIINKSFIVSISLNRDETRDNWRKLPFEEKKKLKEAENLNILPKGGEDDDQQI